MLKKLVGWALIAFMIFFVAFRPDSAAEVVKSLGAGVIDIAQGFGDFFTSLVA
jgi:hypothetical protein